MSIRIAALLLLALPFSQIAQAQDKEPSPTVGEQIIIRMTEKLAKEYAKCTGASKRAIESDGLVIEISGTVAQQLDNGKVRITHTSQVVRGKASTRLVTLTTIVDATKLTTDTMPKGTESYESPDAKPSSTKAESTTHRISLDNLSGSKLSTWVLFEETDG